MVDHKKVIEEHHEGDIDLSLFLHHVLAELFHEVAHIVAVVPGGLILENVLGVHFSACGNG